MNALAIKTLIQGSVLLIISTHYANGQCTLSELFPFAMGSTQYTVIMKTNEMLNIQKNDQYKIVNTSSIEDPNERLAIEVMNQYKQLKRFNKFKFGLDDNEDISFYHQDPLLDDSIRITRLFYDYKYNPCFLTYKGSLKLCFADDKLYVMEITLEFPIEQNKVCIENYERIKSLVKKDFLYTSESEVYNQNNKQIGICTEFYNNQNEHKIDKPEKVYISMTNSQISDNYEIEIIYTNLKNTRFKNKTEYHW